ncbi:MAG: aldolase [Opitutus sp.]|nr:aldolase [Opitutus sp.]
MTGTELSQALRSGKRVYGTAIMSPSARWVPFIARLPIDLVFIDTEHIPLDRETLSWMCVAYRLAGLAPVVRIPSPDPYEACKVIDGGAQGVIAPYVESAEEVRKLVGAVKRRPIKGKKLRDDLSGKVPFVPKLENYINHTNRDNVVIVNIESLHAADSLDDILSVPGVDSVLIGPHDLSCSLDVPEEYDSPRFERVIQTVFKTARRHGVGAGIHSWMGVDREITWAKTGANLLIHSSDILAMSDSLGREITELRDKLQDEAHSIPVPFGVDSV